MDNTESKGADLRVVDALTKRVVLYFEMQYTPRLRHGDHDGNQGVVDQHATEVSLQTIAHDLYEPVNDLLLRAIAACPHMKIALAVNGQTLEYLSGFTPQVVESLKRLNETGAVEWLGVPYHHSLSALVSEDAYRDEVIRNNDLLYEYFGVRPKVLLATPFFVARMVDWSAAMGFEGLMLKPGVWSGRSVIRDSVRETVIMSSDQTVTDAVSKHFGAGEATLHHEEFLALVNKSTDDTVVVGYSYDIFQEHRDSGIYSFFEKFLALASGGWFIHPADAVHRYAEILQWPADLTADTTQWLGNEMQRESMEASRAFMQTTQNRLSDGIRKSWLQLLSADHFVHMSAAHASLTNPYPSPYEAFTNYKTLLDSLVRAAEEVPQEDLDKNVKAVEFERQHPNTPVWAIKEQNKYQEVTRTQI